MPMRYWNNYRSPPTPHSKYSKKQEEISIFLSIKCMAAPFSLKNSYALTLVQLNLNL